MITENIHERYFGNHEKAVYKKTTTKIRQTLRNLHLIEFDCLKYENDSDQFKNRERTRIHLKLQNLRGFGHSQIVHTLMVFDLINFCSSKLPEKFGENPYPFLKDEISIFVKTQTDIVEFSSIEDFLKCIFESEYPIQKISEIDFKSPGLNISSKSSGFNYHIAEEIYSVKRFKKIQQDMCIPHYLTQFFWVAKQGA